MTGLGGVVFTVYGGDTAERKLAILQDIYVDAFNDPPDELSQGLNWMVDAWQRRISTPGFRLVMAEEKDWPIGAVYGHRLPADTHWWADADEPIPREVTREYDGRTVAIIDMMVRPQWRRIGVAELLHALFLAGRTEERATLIVDPANQPAHAAYASWGYHRVGGIIPAAFPDCGPFDAMVLPLRASPTEEVRQTRPR